MCYFQLNFTVISIKDAVIFASVHPQLVFFGIVIIDIIVLELLYAIFGISVLF